MPKPERLKPESIAVMRRLRAHPARVAHDAPGVANAMQHGYLVRVGQHMMMLTPTGRAFLDGVDFVMEAM